MMTQYLAHFHPQAWVNDYAIDVDPDGDVTADVTDALSAMTPQKREAAMVADRYESDELRYAPGTPEWWRNWSGPFYISVEKV